jgi:hypothetical protein
MPAALVTESKDFEPEGPDKPKIKAGTWEFYHFHSNQIHLHVQQRVKKVKENDNDGEGLLSKGINTIGTGVIAAVKVGTSVKGSMEAPKSVTSTGEATKGSPRFNAQYAAFGEQVACYSHSIDRDVKYFYQKFLQRTMDEGNPSISQTKCAGNARLD